MSKDTSLPLIERLGAGYYDMRGMDVPKRPKRVLSRTEMAFFEKQGKTLAEAKEVYNENKAFMDALNTYKREEVKRQNEFFADLAQFHGIDAEHEKTVKAFDLAWDYGHANGFAEVASYFEDLVPLIKD